MRIGAASLAGAGRKRTRGQSMTRLATICAETAVRPAATLLHGECTLVTPNTIQIHGLGTTGRELAGKEGRKGETRGRGLRGGGCEDD